jgi:hypothetical protein
MATGEGYLQYGSEKVNKKRKRWKWGVEEKGSNVRVRLEEKQEPDGLDWIGLGKGKEKGIEETWPIPSPPGLKLL